MIKNIIFDLGGVLLNLDYPRCLASFEKLGFKGVENFLSKYHPSGIFRSLEIGEINEDEFVSSLNNAFQVTKSKEEILTAWGRFLVDVPHKRLELLAELKNRYKLFLLSNTSAPHANIFEKKFQFENGFDSIQDFFDGIYYSFNVGISKPHSKAYNAVLEGSGLIADETLFIDDSEINTLAANELGIHSIVVDDNYNINCIDFENIEKNRNFVSGKRQLN